MTFSLPSPSSDLKVLKARCSLVHKHKHKDIRMRTMAYLTQFSIPALLNPMINKMTDASSAILLMICSHKVWVKVTYDWSTALCLCLCSCRPVFTSQSYDISFSTSTRRTTLAVFLVLMLMLMSTQFSFAYTCACAYTYMLMLRR